ncbi:unnamed protein product [Vitrella brassicaformis CCMP3155]|uniref:RRM domain-containing protein n=2 Tax=Vitrella brassicaformis TaxID=1169539 RepID=A0A0G4FD90_VITBC|nr:unnamed protein product [Vitrella brassicaformis CCMP3155]|eukprot:CEM11203.1 unnamed protein product [Vitrella brassicaformis CCMP3155]
MSGAEKVSEASAYYNQTDVVPSWVERELEVDRRSVYVGNLDYHTTCEELQEHFKSIGPINRVTILVDKYTGHPKGFAYIEFMDVESAENALTLNETSFRQRAIKVVPKRTNVPGLGLRRGGGGGAYSAGPPRGPSRFGGAPRPFRPPPTGMDGSAAAAASYDPTTANPTTANGSSVYYSSSYSPYDYSAYMTAYAGYPYAPFPLTHPPATAATHASAPSSSAPAPAGDPSSSSATASGATAALQSQMQAYQDYVASAYKAMMQAQTGATDAGAMSSVAMPYYSAWPGMMMGMVGTAQAAVSTTTAPAAPTAASATASASADASAESVSASVAQEVSSGAVAVQEMEGGAGAAGSSSSSTDAGGGAAASSTAATSCGADASSAEQKSGG